MDPAPLQQEINLSGKTAIVTGGAMGIGYGIAYRLAEAGASVVVADMNKAAADEAVVKLVAKGWKAIVIVVDVSDAAQVEQMVEAATAAYGSVDILVNNAGIYPGKLVLEATKEDFEKVIHTNLMGAFFASKATARQMITQGRGGKIINITSIDALHPSSLGLAFYDASKHGLWGFTKNLALELAPHKIWVNAIAPGGVNTPGTGAGSMTKEMQEALEPFIAKIPMRRMGESDEIGKVALFLASDLSSYMTGSQVVVDGGVLLA
ncbi:MAG: SDR family NAD(P)-dependent oxidoreductase [bacterium]|nr:SDR family NAD(P)-dependent oxidoreductase [bacterium]